MKKEVKIVPYSPDWPRQFQQADLAIKNALKGSCLNVHHIGSTSVPGLSAKPKIDIMVVVDTLEASHRLETIGYEFTGEWNIPLRYGYRLRSDDLNINLHAVENDHGFIALNLAFRDYLRNHSEARLEYDALKKRLISDPSSHERSRFRFPNYSLRKNAFIKETLKKAGFSGVILNFCTHDEEWRAYRDLCSGLIDDSEPLKANDPQHHHFIFYKGTHALGAAHTECLSDREVVLHMLAIDPSYRRQGFGSQMWRLIEKWLVRKGVEKVAVSSQPPAEAFFRAIGFRPVSGQIFDMIKQLHPKVM